MFISFVKKAKKARYPFLATLFFHEIYEYPKEANPYGLYVKRFEKLIDELYAMDIYFTTVSDLFGNVCRKIADEDGT